MLPINRQEKNCPNISSCVGGSPTVHRGTGFDCLPPRRGSLLSQVFRVRFSAGNGSGEGERIELFEPEEAIHFQRGDDSVPVAEMSRKDGISQVNYFNLRKKYAVLLVNERAIAGLRISGQPPEKIIADSILDREMLQEVARRRSKACPQA